MATITTRSGKGSPLTNTEVDDNFINLNTAKYESGDSPSFSGLTVDTDTLYVDSTNDRVGINNTANRSTGAFGAGQLQVESAGYAAFQIFSNANTVDGSYIGLWKSRGGANGSTTIVQNGDTVGAIYAGGYDGTKTVNGARVQFDVDGVPGTNDMPTRIIFGTTADGTVTPTERMRIDNAGRVGINVGGNPAYALDVKTAGTNNGQLRVGGSTTTTTGLLLEQTNSGTTTANIQNSYYATSASASLSIKSGYTTFHTGTSGTEAMRIESTRRVSVGGGAVRTNYFGSSSLYYPSFGVEYTGTGNASEVGRFWGHTYNSGGDNRAGMLLLGKSRGTDRLTNTVLTSSDTVYRIGFLSSDGTYMYESAEIAVEADGSMSSGDVPGRLIFKTTADGTSSPTERMRIDNQGRVGIGSNPINSPAGFNKTMLSLTDDGGSPSLVMRQSAGNEMEMGLSASGGWLGTSDGFDMRFVASNTEAMRIDSSRRVLIGATTARSMSVNPIMQLEGLDANTAFSITRNSNDASSGSVRFLKSRGTSDGSEVVVQDNDNLGAIYWMGSDGTDSANFAAAIWAQVDGTPLSGGDGSDMPGRLVFATTADGTNSAVERMRIDSTGRVAIGTTTPENYYTGANLLVISHPTNDAGLTIVTPTDEIGRIHFADGTTGNAQYRGYIAYLHTDDRMEFGSSGQEAMSIDSQQRVLIGTAAAQKTYNTAAYPIFQVSDSGFALANIISYDTNAGNYAQWITSKSRTSTIGTQALVNNGDGLGIFGAQGSDGTEFVEAASIRMEVDGAAAANDMPGRIKFLTTADGASAGTERMRISSGGQVNIGENINVYNNPNLQIRTTDDTAIGSADIWSALNKPSIDIRNPSNTQFTYAGINMFGGSASNSFAGIHMVQTTANAAGALTFWTGGLNAGSPYALERMRIHYNGEVSIGSTGVYGTKLSVHDSKAGTYAYTDTVGFPNDAAVLAVVNAENQNGAMSKVRIEGDTGNGTSVGWDITCISGVAGTYDADLTFGRRIGSAAWQEYGRFARNGSFIVATAAPTLTTRFNSWNTSGTGACRFTVSNNEAYTYDNYNGSGYYQIDFRWNNAETGRIQVSSTGTTYNTSSDYRLKENVVDITSAIDTVKQLQPKQFNFIADPTIVETGFIAHEVEEVLPHVVTGKKDATLDVGDITDAEGNLVKDSVREPETLEEGQTWTYVQTVGQYQQMDYARLTPILTAALKEAVAKIEALEARVAALETP